MRIADAEVRTRLELPLGDWRSWDTLKDAAVLLLLVDRDGEDHLVFNRRRDDLPWHAGQICFPGGAREGEEDAVGCALRETCEEMGIRAEDVEVLGRLPDRVSIAGFKVSPFVGRYFGEAPYRIEAAEVAEVFEVPCRALLDDAAWGYTETQHRLARYRRVPYFDWSGERRIWGLTGIILRDFVTQVMGRAPRIGDAP